MKFFHHLLIALFLFSSNFFAQSDNEDYTLEEIIVTAQKTEKSLQDVPIAVSALSADDLALRQAVRFTDLQLTFLISVIQRLTLVVARYLSEVLEDLPQEFLLTNQ